MLFRSYPSAPLVPRQFGKGIVAMNALHARDRDIVAYFFEPSFFHIGTVAAAIVLFMHRSNIIRIIYGDEQKIIKSRRKNYDE